jgi:hypothetical protein
MSLPRTAVDGAWKRTSHTAYTSWRIIKRHLGESPEIFTEFRLQRLDKYEYIHPESTVQLEVRMYQLGTDDDAFGLYSYLLPADAERYKVGDEAFRVGTVLVVKRGRAVLRIKPSHGGVALDSMLAFAQSICEDLPAGSLPQAVEALMKIMKTDDPSSVRYGHSDIMATQLLVPDILEHLHLTSETDFAYGFMKITGIETYMVVVEYPSVAEAKRVYEELSGLQKEDLLFNLMREDTMVEFLTRTTP